MPSYGGRIYTVGWTTVGNDISVVRRSLAVPTAHTTPASRATASCCSRSAPPARPTTARGITLLPDGRLRDRRRGRHVSGSTANFESYVVGLLPDGSLDPSFGDGGDGIQIFPVGPETTRPTGMAVDAAGPARRRPATRRRRTSRTRSSPCATPDGSPVASFGTDGVRAIAARTPALTTTAVDVAFRPGRRARRTARACRPTSRSAPTTPGEARGSVRLREDGSDDPASVPAGEVVLTVGEPPTRRRRADRAPRAAVGDAATTVNGRDQRRVRRTGRGRRHRPAVAPVRHPRHLHAAPTRSSSLPGT